jgi:hypothetical protein
MEFKPPKFIDSKKESKSLSPLDELKLQEQKELKKHEQYLLKFSKNLEDTIVEEKLNKNRELILEIQQKIKDLETSESK